MTFSFLPYWLEKILSFEGGPFKAFQHKDQFFFFVFTDLHLVLPFWQNSTLEPRSYGHQWAKDTWPYERGSNVLFCQNGKTKWRSVKTKKKKIGPYVEKL